MTEQTKGLTPEERADLIRMLRYGATIVGAVAVMVLVWALLAGVFNFEVGGGQGAPQVTPISTPAS